MDSVLVKFPDNFYDAACLNSLIGDTITSLSYLRKAFENGFRRFAHLSKDNNMQNVRATVGYKALYEEFWQKSKYIHNRIPIISLVAIATIFKIKFAAKVLHFFDMHKKNLHF